MSTKEHGIVACRDRPTALVVEDDEEVATAIGEVLREDSFEIEYAFTLLEARELLASSTPSLLVLDLHLPDGFGGDLLTDLVIRHEAPATVLVSGFELASYVAEKFGLELVSKPFEAAQLSAAAARALAERRRPTRPPQP